ncbi:MAG: carbohydrate ABC transporter permease [Clostridiaceae bacterium]|nr:carbohydrate ABC transporter permease [Clostridiaceae bacterium]
MSQSNLQKRSGVRRLGKRFTVTDIIIALCLLFVAAATLYPVIYMVSVSISDARYVERSEVWLWPRGINFNAYLVVARHEMLLRAYGNSFFYLFVRTTYQVIMTVLLAYPLSRSWCAGRKTITFFAAFTMWFSGGLIPYFLVLFSLGLFNNYAAILIPSAVSVWNMIILRTGFSQLPDSIEESAKIDGANDATIMIRLFVPMSKPVLATVTLFYAVANWNSWFWPSILLRNHRLWPMTLVVRNLLIELTDPTFNREIMGGGVGGTVPNPVSFRAAIVVMTMLPMLILYPFIQRYFVKGITIGSIKG